MIHKLDPRLLFPLLYGATTILLIVFALSGNLFSKIPYTEGRKNNDLLTTWTGLTIVFVAGVLASTTKKEKK